MDAVVMAIRIRIGLEPHRDGAAVLTHAAIKGSIEPARKDGAMPVRLSQPRAHRWWRLALSRSAALSLFQS